MLGLTLSGCELQPTYHTNGYGHWQRRVCQTS